MIGYMFVDEGGFVEARSQPVISGDIIICCAKAVICRYTSGIVVMRESAFAGHDSLANGC